MLFNSYVFLFIFLPLTWMAFRFACQKRFVDVAIAILLIASLIFYAYWNPPFVFLILFSILFNYSCGLMIQRTRLCNKRALNLWLYSGVLVNLTLIGYFKYANFFMTNIAVLGGWQWTAQEIFLPLGISFFTIQQIAYLFDSSKGLTKGHGFIYYALFVTFFPQLIAGPIVLYEQIIPQFLNRRAFGLNYRNIALGLTVLTLGLFKKVVIADTFSPWVAAVFDTSYSVTFFEAWVGSLCYTLQIYFDFSGYSDMAIGLGLLFNINIPINFNSPYKATSIIEFWRRWHITLSEFLRDYLYIPLGGNKIGTLRRYFNIMITMLLGGLWHGASWNFLVWGGIHGFFLCLNHGYRHFVNSWGFCTPRPARWVITFTIIVFAWVFFRAPSIARAWDIILGMTGFNGIVLPPQYLPFPWLREILARWGIQFYYPSTWSLIGAKWEVGFLIVCLAGVVFLPNSYEWVIKKVGQPGISLSIVVGLAMVISILFMDRISEFLYFQF